MQKVERDGKIAVLVSGGYGAGWSTWNSEYAEVLCMDADIVNAVLEENYDKAVEIAADKCAGAYLGGIDGLYVAWVKKGSFFEIDEYDGNESLHVIGERNYLQA